MFSGKINPELTNMHTWRLIITSPSRGAWNMAVDEALLQTANLKPNTPTLRLYSWYPYALSLGHAQSFEDIDQSRIEARGWDIVRRPTGGRAILHADELTYALIWHEEYQFLSGGVLESYRKISDALIQGLQILGVNAKSTLKEIPAAEINKEAVCFQHPSDYEITHDGKKIIGSAQARRKGNILQHGAIPLHGDITRIIDVLNYPNPDRRENAKSKLSERAITLSDAVGRRITWNLAANALIAGFVNTFRIIFLPSRLTDEEISLTEQIYKQKHNTNIWIKRL